MHVLNVLVHVGHKAGSMQALLSASEPSCATGAVNQRMVLCPASTGPNWLAVTAASLHTTHLVFVGKRLCEYVQLNGFAQPLKLRGVCL